MSTKAKLHFVNKSDVAVLRRVFNAKGWPITRTPSGIVLLWPNQIAIAIDALVASDLDFELIHK